MRSFTKKNLRYEDGAGELIKLINSNSKNATDLLTLLNSSKFKAASKQLINLEDNAYINTLIDKERDAIKNVFAALNNQYVQNFHGNFTNNNFPNVDITKITALVKSQYPMTSDIENVLNGTGTNKVDILAAPHSVLQQTIENIIFLLKLKRLVDSLKITSEYTDATYDICNNIDINKKGIKYGKAKKFLIKSTGLYCAYCESVLSDGHITDVEHKIPKGTFTTVERKWSNFVLACERCNTGFKSDRYVHPEGSIEKDTSLPLTAENIDPQTVQSLDIQQLTAVMNNIISNKTIIKARNKVQKPSTEQDLRTAALSRVLQKVKILPLPKSIQEDIATIAIYNCTLKYAQDQVIWPDQPYTNGVSNNKPLTSFEVFDYALRKSNSQIFQGGPISLDNLKLDTAIEIDANYKMNLTGLHNRPNEIDVQLRIVGISKLDKQVRKAASNMLQINGLNELHKKEEHIDQRMIRRTKAWFHAMKQLKILTGLTFTNVKDIHDYYSENLHPVNITISTSIVQNLRDTNNGAATTIQLNPFEGGFTVAHNLTNGEVTLDNIILNNIISNNITLNDTTPGVNLKGEITEENGSRCMTGSLEITQSKDTNLQGKIILFKDAVISSNTLTNQNSISIGPNQGVISHASDALKEWDNNRADLLRMIDQLATIQQDFIWENILDMVRLGGFYSTWVRTFQRYSYEKNLYDIDLVRRLEMKAQENPEDPFNFHGTDTEKIIAAIS